MSYSIIHTDAFVIKTIPEGESNITIILLTRELGKIYVHAQNARSLNSKMRYLIQQYAHGMFSLVRGKHQWRLIGIEHRPSLSLGNTEHYGAVPMIARVLQLVHRLLPNEGDHEEVYSHFSNLYMLLCTHRLSVDDQEMYEILVVIHILQSLGYWDRKTIYAETLAVTPSKEAITLLQSDKKQLIAQINTVMAETQL